MMLQISVATLLCLLSFQALHVTAQRVASKAYTPVAGACPPDFTLVRMAGSSPDSQTLSSSEAAYVHARRTHVIPNAWKAYLAKVEARLRLSHVEALPSYVSDILTGCSRDGPNLGIAVSGGGYRASIFGAGVLDALDGRSAPANDAGTGGLLQTATYLTGLSGGAWLLTSLAQADFPTMRDLIFGYADASSACEASWGGWNANYSLYGPSSDDVADARYLARLTQELEGKRDAGHPVTVADYWGRALARHFVNGTCASNFFDDPYTHGAGILWSSVAETESFASYAIPFPIVVADLSVPGQESDVTSEMFVPMSNPIIEFNVFETGSFDPMLSAFAPTKYLGTRNESVCITNYDQSSFVAATSSSLFNELSASGMLNSTLGPELSLVKSFMQEPSPEVDVAAWPNPFYGVAPETFIASNQTNLNVVDGGEDGEVIPLQPLLVKARGVDTILVIDAFENVDNFAAGSSLIATQDRAKSLSSAYTFPPVPKTEEEFIAQNLSTRPTFFGCDEASANGGAPLVIYVANGGPPRNGDAPLTNTSSLQVVYDAGEIRGMLDQTFVVATQGYPADADATTDPEWPACLACAVVDRARERRGEKRGGVCGGCFARYCWSG